MSEKPTEKPLGEDVFEHANAEIEKITDTNETYQKVVKEQKRRQKPR